jgi:hypothetical protein
MNSKILETLNQFNTRKLTWTEKTRKAIGRAGRAISVGRFIRNYFGVPADTEPHDRDVQATILDPDKVRWTIANEKIVEKLVGKIDQLEDDMSAQKPDIISFGYEVRGKENIRNFIFETLQKSYEIERMMKEDIDAKFPYLRKSRVVPLGIFGALSAGMGYLMAPEVIHAFNGTLTGWEFAKNFPIDTWLVWGTIIPTSRQLLTYGYGFISKKGRVAYEDEHTIERLGEREEIYENILSVLEQGNEVPDAFIYNGIRTEIPIQYKDELLRASNDRRDVSTEVLSKAIILDRKSDITLVDRNYLLVDQLFFFDDVTREPVLVNFLRLKKRVQFGIRKKKTPPEKVRATQEDFGTATPGLAQ